MANTLNLGSGNWGAKDSLLLGYYEDGGKFFPETFDVTRATGGTRVNKNGLIETPTEILSGELVTNGDFANDSEWTLGTGWTIANGKLTANNATGYALQVGVFESGVSKTYRINLSISDYVSGYFTILTSGGTSQSQQFNANGNYTIDFNSNSPSGTTLHFTYFGSFTGSIDNVSVIEINDKNLARIDYLDDANGVLLTEPQSTNLIQYSESFDNSYWTKSGSSVVGGFSFPSADNPLGAFKLVENTVTTTHQIQRSSSFLDAKYSLSAFVKADERNWIKVNLYDGSSSVYSYFDLTNGVVGQELGASGKIENYGNGWYKCSISSTSNVSSGNGNISIRLAENNGGTGYTGDGTSGVYIFGAQLEQQSYATSYIPTEGSTVTRNADLVNNGGDVNNFGSEGVLFVEASSLFDIPTTDGIIRIENSLDSSNEYVDLRYDTSQNRVQIVVRVGGVNQTTSGVVISDTTDNNKFALKYKENDISLWINGVEEITVSSSSVPSGLNELLFGQFYGKTKNIQVFNEALSDSDLLSLTTTGSVPYWRQYSAMATSLNYTNK